MLVALLIFGAGVAHAAPPSPSQVVEQVEAALSAGNVDAFAAWFAPEGVVREGSVAISGRDQIRTWAQGLISRNYQTVPGPRTVQGSRVSWTARVTFDGLKALGVDQVEARAEAVVENGKMKTYVPPFSPGMQAMMGAAQAAPPDGDDAGIRAFYDEVFSQGKAEAVDARTTPDFADRVPLAGKAPTAAGLKEGVAELRAAMPDFAVIVEDVLVIGDRAAVRLAWTGTHKDKYQGAPATFRQIRVPVIEFLKLRDGKIAERWSHPDQIAFQRQLGIAAGGGTTTGRGAEPADRKASAAKKGKTGGLLGFLNDL
jgi:steroid delta-isomerase-like uncharacterized protein